MRATRKILICIPPQHQPLQQSIPNTSPFTSPSPTPAPSPVHPMQAKALAVIVLTGLVAINAQPFHTPQGPESVLSTLSPHNLAQSIPRGTSYVARQTQTGFNAAKDKASNVMNSISTPNVNTQSVLQSMQTAEHPAGRRRSQAKAEQRIAAKLLSATDARAAIAGSGHTDKFFASLTTADSKARREGYTDYQCELSISDSPSQEQLDHLCTDQCCHYTEDLANDLDISERDVNKIVCAKHEEDYCLAILPNITNDAETLNDDDLSALCESPCTNSWIAFFLRDWIDDNYDDNEDTSLETLAYWLCSQREDRSYCIVNDLDMEQIDEANATVLAEVCGTCKDYYFGQHLSDSDRDFLDTTLCQRDTNLDWCYLNQPIITGDDLTNAEVAMVCDSPCRDAWFGFLTPEGSERTGDSITAAASRMCMQDSVSGDYCAINPIEIDLDEPGPGALAAVCDSACKDFHILSASAQMGLRADQIETLLCSRAQNGSFCSLLPPPTFIHDYNIVEADDSDLQEFCSHECAESWVQNAAFILGPNLTPADFLNVVCAKEQEDDEHFCLPSLFATNTSLGNQLQSAFEDESLFLGITPELMDVLCDNGGTCTHVLHQLLFAEGTDVVFGALGGSYYDVADANLLLEAMCTRRESTGQYCFLETIRLVEETLAVGDAPGYDEPEYEEFLEDFIGGLLSLWCGECSAQVGQHDFNTLFVAIFGFGAFGDFRRNMDDRGALRGESGVLLNMMCMEGDDGYCLQDLGAVEFLFSSSAFSSASAVLFGEENATAFATPFCENSCVNALLSTGMTAELFQGGHGHLQAECLSPDSRFIVSALRGACYPNTATDEYCLETVAGTFGAGEMLHEACDPPVVDESVPRIAGAGDRECSATCAGNVSAYVGAMGCCAGHLALSVFDEIFACEPPMPAGCDGVGSFTITFDVPNLQYSWVQGEAMQARFRGTVEHDVAVALGFSRPLVTLLDAAPADARRSESGTTFTVELALPTTYFGESVATRIARTMQRLAPTDEMPLLLNAVQSISILDYERSDATFDVGQGIVGMLHRSGIAASGREATRILRRVFPEEPSGPQPGDPLPTRHYQFRPDALLANDGTDGPTYALQTANNGANQGSACGHEGLQGCYTTHFIGRAIIPDLVASDYGTEGWTVCMWMKVDEDPYTFLQWGGTWASTLWYLGYVSAHGGYFFPTASHYSWAQTSQFHVPKSPAEVLGQWHHYCWVADFRTAGDHSLFIDGVQGDAPYRFDNAIDPSSAQFEGSALQTIEIGSAAWKTMQFGDLRLYNQPLTPDQVCRVAGAPGCAPAPTEREVVPPPEQPA